jgi:hypothetical protein
MRPLASVVNGQLGDRFALHIRDRIPDGTSQLLQDGDPFRDHGDDDGLAVLDGLGGECEEDP